jgi:hypothetical protein
VLLPAGLFSRRADSGVVIAAAVALAAAGLGFRRIAAVLGRPEPTVRDWVQAASHVTGPACSWFALAGLITGADPSGVRPRKSGPGLTGLISAARWLAACLAQRSHQTILPWWVAAAVVCRCCFLQTSWWDQNPQHQPVLPLGPDWPSGWLAPALIAGRAPPGP